MLMATWALVALGLLGRVLDHRHDKAYLSTAVKGEFNGKAVTGFQGLFDPKHH